MKKSTLYILFVATVSITSCKKDNNSSAPFEQRSASAADYSAATLPVSAVSNDITGNVTWDAGHVWEISGIVTVRSGATLTIEPGTYIKAAVNTTGVQNGVLVIGKYAKINAVGTAASPIVFTSRYLLDGNESTKGNPGDFGGLVILGRARLNVPGGDKLIEGVADDPKFHYGGTTDIDNSGTLKYTRIEYAGFQLGANIGLNSLTLSGVGSGTQIDHVQSSYALGDGFAFFGGTVSPGYLISIGASDDQFDFNNGYTGSIQYAIAAANAYSEHSSASGSSDSNGIESDNNTPSEDAQYSLLPKTHPILSNFSVIGTSMATLTPPIIYPGFKYGFRNRRGAEFTLINSLFTGYPSGIVFDADASATPSTINNISVQGFTAAITVYHGAYTRLGTIITSTATQADKFGMQQPFINSNNGVVQFVAPGTKGAVLISTGSWTSNWAKFVY